MLILARKMGEKIHIGADIVLTVLLIDGNKIRLGLEAPRDIPIWRGELLDRGVVAGAAIGAPAPVPAPATEGA